MLQVIAAYRFIQEHYNEGDRICESTVKAIERSNSFYHLGLFGFSRGAYTARALCGFLHAIGVLPRSNTQQVDYAYEIWKSGCVRSLKLSQKNSTDLQFFVQRSTFMVSPCRLGGVYHSASVDGDHCPHE